MHTIYTKVKNLYLKYKSIIFYIFFGAITTLVDFIFYYLSKYLFITYSNFSSEIIITLSSNIAWIIAVITAFITNKLIVFSSKSLEPKVLIKEFIPFVSARILSNFMNIFILLVGVELLGVNDFFVKIFSSVIVLIFNYIASKFFIFKKK